MIIIRYNEPQELDSFICTANDFRYDNSSHSLIYSHYEGANQIIWDELKDVDMELSNMNAVPVLYVRSRSVHSQVLD